VHCELVQTPFSQVPLSQIIPQPPQFIGSMKVSAVQVGVIEDVVEGVCNRNVDVELLKFGSDVLDEREDAVLEELVNGGTCEGLTLSDVENGMEVIRGGVEVELLWKATVVVILELSVIVVALYMLT
jgi:hypothetical protein